VPRPVVDPRFAETLRRLRAERGLSLRDLARRAVHGKSYIQELETGRKVPSAEVAARLDDALGASGMLAAMVYPQTAMSGVDDEFAALDLAHRVGASDVSAETLDRLDTAVDDLAVGYARIPPEQLLPRVRQHLRYVRRLLDGRTTLAQHRRLLVSGGWLSLLAATVHIDLRHRGAAGANLTAAGQLAEHAGHDELAAWCVETRAWDVLTVGDYRHAVELSQQAQALAPRGSSALIQATAQEGRAWARMGRQKETRNALHRVARLVSPLPVPDRPEHHYRYDPGKAISYAATTLAWAGDPAAEEYARQVLVELEAVNRPRRTALAWLDLSLALLAAGRADEASGAALTAFTSGWMVPSTWWRATEVMAGVESAGTREAAELRDAFEAYRPRG
jgi:transcriptional regulator with XRE-family HTH domain